MEVIVGRAALAAARRGCVATIGNFDGVHLGHQMVLRQLAEVGEALGQPTAVVLFEPQPGEYFRPQASEARLSRLREKIELLRPHPVDRVVCLRFDAALARMPAPAFVQELLVDGLGVRELVIGPVFRFGAGRAGDFALLREMGAEAGFGVRALEPHCRDGERVSSTAVRQALAAGDLERATQLLGRPYSVSGRVQHGRELGRTIGFPTANLPWRRRGLCLRGVFAVRVQGLDRPDWPGVANLGFRPTVQGEMPLLEVHVFDYSGSLYGQRLRVDFIARLRPEQRFESLQALQAQIALDSEAARQLLMDGAGDEVNRS